MYSTCCIDFAWYLRIFHDFHWKPLSVLIETRLQCGNKGKIFKNLLPIIHREKLKLFNFWNRIGTPFIHADVLEIIPVIFACAYFLQIGRLDVCQWVTLFDSLIRLDRMLCIVLDDWLWKTKTREKINAYKRRVHDAGEYKKYICMILVNFSFKH